LRLSWWAGALAAIASACALDPAPAGAATTASNQIVSLTPVGGGVEKMMYRHDGLVLEALVDVPAGVAPRAPVLVVLHGGYLVSAPRLRHFPLGQTAPGMIHLSDLFPDAIVIAPEYRGYLQSQGHPAMVNANASDAEAALALVDARFGANRHAVYLLGYSDGGAVALAMAETLPGVRAVVGVSPFTGYALDYAWENWQLGTDTDTAYGIVTAALRLRAMQFAFGGSPGQVPARYAAALPDGRLTAITAPVLLLQGTADRHVLWQATRALSNRLAALGKRIRFVLYPGGHHGLHTAPYQAESDARIIAWLTRYGLT